MKWGPWIDSYKPEIGMYIQTEETHEETGERRRTEGLLIGTNRHVFWYLGEVEQDQYECKWMADRWRQRIDGVDADETVRRKQEEPV